jgi:putative DNA primase/helicase
MARSRRSSIPPAAIGAPLWWPNLILNGKGAPRAIEFNGDIALRGDPAFANAIRFDFFRNQTMVAAPLPWDPNTVVPRPWEDNDDQKAMYWVQEHGIMLKVNPVHNIIEAIAKDDGYHPIRDYIKSVVWDKVKRTKIWLPSYLGAKHNLYTEEVGRKYLISCVARIFEPGCKVDCVLALEGPQGIYKSTTLAVLGGPWYANDIAALGTRDSKEQVIGAWIIELDELDAVNKASDWAAVNSFVTTTTDRFRFSWGRRVRPYPRQCVFGATTNRENWLRDDTGGRRFWPVKCGTIDIDALRHDRDQLWAEAAELYFAGESHYLQHRAVIDMATKEQEARYEEDPWSGIVRARQDELRYSERNATINGSFVRHAYAGVDINEFFRILDVPPERRNRSKSTRLGIVLRKLEWRKVRIRCGDYIATRYFTRDKTIEGDDVDTD